MVAVIEGVKVESLNFNQFLGALVHIDGFILKNERIFEFF